MVQNVAETGGEVSNNNSKVIGKKRDLSSSHTNDTSTNSKRVSKAPVRLVDELVDPTSSVNTAGKPKTLGKVEILPSQPLPTRNKTTGEILFGDYPSFRPNRTPQEVLQAGSFGGTYFRPIKSSVTGLSYDGETWKEFPAEWFTGLNVRTHVSSITYKNSINKYGVNCGGDLFMWESSGWISHVDPYGWFQWYCRFYMGRRCSDDERQIARGLGVFGPKGRWRNNLINKIRSAHSSDLTAGLNDKSISPVIRQLLLHWGYELTLKDLQGGK